ncbi:hypothetical protein [Nostoc sp.]
MPTVVTEQLVSAVEPCRTPTGILLARASCREVRATPTDNSALGSH